MNYTKAGPMTKEEAMLLVELVAAHKIINNKATNATNNKLKEEAWAELSNSFNSAITSFPRTAAQLRLKWENLKKTARKRCANIRRSSIETGGGKDYMPPDELLDKVASLLGNTCTGLPVEFGGDATNAKNIVKCEAVLEDMSTSTVEHKDDGNASGQMAMERSDEGKILRNYHNIDKTSKSKKMFFRSASGSKNIAKRRNIDEESNKARIDRDNAMTMYLLAKKKKIDMDLEEKALIISKLKLELENAKLENMKLRSELNKI